MKKPAFFSGLLMLVVGALLALAAMFWLPHCGGEKPMRCIWMLHAVCGVGLVVAISGVLMQFAARGVAMGLQIANVLNGLLVVALSTFLIGACPNPLMGCHTVTEPILVVCGAVLALIALVDFWRLSKKQD